MEVVLASSARLSTVRSPPCTRSREQDSCFRERHRGDPAHHPDLDRPACPSRTRAMVAATRGVGPATDRL